MAAAFSTDAALAAVVKASHRTRIAQQREAHAWRTAHHAGASLRAIAGAAGCAAETVRKTLKLPAAD